MENNNINAQEPSTAQYAVVIKVDVERIRQARLEELGVARTEESLDEAVCQELGWAAPSGVNTDSLELMEDIGEKTPYIVWVVCRYDGFEFTEKRLLLVDKGVKPEKAAEELARCFEPESEYTLDEESGTYSFVSGKDVWIDTVNNISELEYHILKKYL